MVRTKRWIIFERIPQRQIQFDPDKKIEQLSKHKIFTESQKCPKCKNQELQVHLIEEGKEGWELAFQCQSCKTRGVINDTGFRVDFTQKVEIKE